MAEADRGITELPVWYRPDGPKQPAEIAAELSSLILVRSAGASSEVGAS